MSYISEHFKLHFEPVADPGAVVQYENVRFTVLTDRIIRMEFSPEGRFEDRPTRAFWFRRQPVPEYKVIQDELQTEIITEFLHLTYTYSKHGFNKDNLSIKLSRPEFTGKNNDGKASAAADSIWQYGDRNYGNLKGTMRTLDGTKGNINYEEGLVSRLGWSVYDDSRNLVFTEEGWITTRFDKEETVLKELTKDMYFFGYGHDYASCVRDFCRLSGNAALLPRWALGNWWSRYWAYTQEELTQLMQDFREHEIPLSVCIVDMDWHITQTPYSSGWTGYTWNRELFPDHRKFISFLHENGLKTALNLHPHSGICPHEDNYKRMADFMGIDPASKECVDFDIADPKFTKGYFEIMHHPYEEEGIDFWWMDWQQGTNTKMEGLDPLWWLNHLHFYDLGRDGSKRPFIFSRWGGLGCHRYPIGFSGDTVVAWESLQAQPYFTATAANVAFSWWSHDIGGHFKGKENPELYTRWVQFGVFSPIFRLHSSSSTFLDRRPWGFDREVYAITKEAMQLRHSLIPYIYTASWNTYTKCTALCTPMYYKNPENEEAYSSPNQYYFGTELIAAPFVTPKDPDTCLSRQSVWLPEGEWFDFFSGEYYEGNKTYGIYGKLDQIPAFAKAGAIVPLAPKSAACGVRIPSELMIDIFPGMDNSFELFEDDGETTEYLKGKYCITRFEQQWTEKELIFRILPAKGDKSVIPQSRTYSFIIKGVNLPEEIILNINNQPEAFEYDYEDHQSSLRIKNIVIHCADSLELILSNKHEQLMSRSDRRFRKFRDTVRSFNLDSGTKQVLAEHDDSIINFIDNPCEVLNYSNLLTGSQICALTELLERRAVDTH